MQNGKHANLIVFHGVKNMAVQLYLGTSAGRAGSPLPAAVANPRARIYHAGAHGATRPTCPTDAKNGFTIRKTVQIQTSDTGKTNRVKHWILGKFSAGA